MRLLPVFLILPLFGCARGPYQYGRFRPEGAEPPPLVIEHGGPNERLDKYKEIVELPRKLLSFGRVPVDQSTDGSELQVVQYLEKNDLTDVYVEVNHYDPDDQWRRLKANENVGPIWKYTAGVASVLGYSLFPGRVFGRDNYNPYTNTLSINSSDPNNGLYEAAFAKDVHSQKHIGNYVMFSKIPGISLIHTARMTEDVLGYLQAEEIWDLETAAYPSLYSRLGSKSAGLVGSPFVSTLIAPAVSIGDGFVGRAAGSAVASQRSQEIRLARSLQTNQEIREWLAETSDASHRNQIQLVSAEFEAEEVQSADEFHMLDKSADDSLFETDRDAEFEISPTDISSDE